METFKLFSPFQIKCFNHKYGGNGKVIIILENIESQMDLGRYMRLCEIAKSKTVLSYESLKSKFSSRPLFSCQLDGH